MYGDKDAAAKDDFNPLHHEGGDHGKSRTAGLLVISIHSTTRVETALTPKQKIFADISIHSTTRVETIHRPEFDCALEISIHSTTRVETSVNRYGLLQYLISIHSTTRVETRQIPVHFRS